MAISTISQAGLNAPITLTSPVLAGTPTGVGVLTSGTAVASTSGTSIDFTGIPSWVKRVTVMLNGVSTNGTSSLRFRLGAGSVESSGYLSACAQIGPSTASLASTSGFDGTGDNGASYTRNGTLTFTLLGSNSWTLSGAYNIGAGQSYLYIFTGSKTTSGTLDRVCVTTVNGSDTFDAGSVNILYE